MQIIQILPLMFLLPSSNCFINCRTACKNCDMQNFTPQLLEVYCGMCKECKLRRKEQLRYAIGRNKDNEIEYVDQNNNKNTEAQQDINENLGHVDTAMKSEEQKLAMNSDSDLIDNVDPDRQDISKDLKHVFNHSKPKSPPVNTDNSATKESDNDNKLSTDNEYPPGCATPPPCSDDEEEIRPRYVTFVPGPVPYPFPAPYCPIYKPCEYTYPSTTTPYIAPTTTTTTSTTQRTTVTQLIKRSTRKKLVKPLRLIRPLPYVPCFMPVAAPYNPCPILQPPAIPMEPISMPSNPPMHTAATNYPRRVPLASTKSKITDDNFYVYVGVPKHML